METLGFFDWLWRIPLAGLFALSPGLLFWTLVLALLASIRRFGHPRRASKPTTGTARP